MSRLGDSEVLAIDPRWLASVQAALTGAFTPSDVQARVGVSAARGPAVQREETTVVIPLMGILAPRGSLLMLLFGGTPLDAFRAALREAAADASVSRIVLAVDSPGGSVRGVEEAAAVVANAARVKPVVAVADTLMASAAYWIAAGASEVVVTPSAEVGSIGVAGIHTDVSKANDARGVRVTYVVSAKYKAEGNADEPLSAEARAYMQQRVDEFDRMMTARIAAGRRVSVERVRTGFGEGRVLGAAEAVRRGMADRIGTLEETLARAARGESTGVATGASAALAWRRRRLAAAACSGGSARDLDWRRRRLQLAALRIRG